MNIIDRLIDKIVDAKKYRLRSFLYCEQIRWIVESKQYFDLFTGHWEVYSSTQIGFETPEEALADAEAEHVKDMEKKNLQAQLTTKRVKLK